VAPPRPSVIQSPDWSRRPNADDLARYFPDRAQRMGVEGKATLSCSVNAKGTLENCSIVSEDPADYGFGEATMKASKLFKMKPKTLDGAPVEGGQVRIPLRWVLPKG
jgi:protein TonB